jgi:hypothetical protein
MPTINPRVQVTLSPSLDVMVSRLAQLQRCSKSQVLRELLEAAEPGLQRAMALMDAASKAVGSVHSGLSRSLDRVHDSAEDGLAVMLSRMDRVTEDLVSQAEAVKGRRPAREVRGGGVHRRSLGALPPPPPAPSNTGGKVPRGAQNPPSSNRGVKSTRKKGPETPVTPKKRGGAR